jgi:photosystem II stability/assembly factor-like uncharacterized protein
MRRIDQKPGTIFLFSRDGGKTLSEIETKHLVIDMLPDPANDKRIIGMTPEGKLIESYDDGKSWKVFKDLNVKCTSQKPCNLFVSSKRTIFIYGGYGGSHFIRVDEKKKTKSEFQWVEFMTMTPWGDILVGALGRGNNYENVFKSADDGLTWKRIFDVDRAGRLYVSPKGTLFACGQNMDFDNFKCFKVTNEGMKNLPFHFSHVLFTSPSGSIVTEGRYAQDTLSNYFFSYDDGLTWTKLFKDDEVATLMQGETEGLIVVKERDGKLIKDKLKTKYLSTDDYLFFCQVSKLTDQGDSLRAVCHKKNEILSDVEMKWKETYQIKNILYLKTQKGVGETFFIAHGGKLYRTFDNGKTWQDPINTGIRINKIVLHPKNKDKIYFIGADWPDL